MSNYSFLLGLAQKSQFLWMLGGIFLIIAQIVSLLHILRREDFKDSTEKMMWALLVAVSPILGVVFYYFIKIRSNEDVKQAC